MSTAATIRTIGAGNSGYHAMTNTNPKYLQSGCPVCCASKGAMCRGRNGAILSGMHKERRDKWAAERAK